MTDAGGDGRDTEDAANDDYYVDAATTADNPEAASGKSPTTGESRSSDQSPATDDSPPGPPSGDAADEAVMAAAAEIVTFAQLRDSAEADAILRSVDGRGPDRGGRERGSGDRAAAVSR